jgi:hypothetical protein
MFWVSEACLGLVRFSPDCSENAQLPTDADAAQLMAWVRKWTVFERSDNADKTALVPEEGPEPPPARIWQESERWHPSSPEGRLTIATPIKPESIPVPKPWSPKFVESIKFPQAVEELTESPRFSLKEVVQTVLPMHGGEEWQCCLDVVRQLGIIETRKRFQQRPERL